MSRLSEALKSVLLGAVKSNTMQFNFGAAVLWFLGVLSDASFVTDNPEYTAILAGVVAVVNMFLRAKTTKPLSER